VLCIIKSTFRPLLPAIWAQHLLWIVRSKKWYDRLCSNAFTFECMLIALFNANWIIKKVIDLWFSASEFWPTTLSCKLEKHNDFFTQRHVPEACTWLIYLHLHIYIYIYIHIYIYIYIYMQENRLSLSLSRYGFEMEGGEATVKEWYKQSCGTRLIWKP
jgi:hypothetical protein